MDHCLFDQWRYQTGSRWNAYSHARPPRLRAAAVTGQALVTSSHYIALHISTGYLKEKHSILSILLDGCSHIFILGHNFGGIELSFIKIHVIVNEETEREPIILFSHVNNSIISRQSVIFDINTRRANDNSA